MTTTDGKTVATLAGMTTKHRPRGAAKATNRIIRRLPPLAEIILRLEQLNAEERVLICSGRSVRA